MNTTVIDMATPLDPLISEFDTAEEADAYDRWFRAEVEASLAETGRNRLARAIPYPACA
ncbi:hypothetical protein LJR034_008322 [Caballeronia sp. LjRoot34]|uniref:type II toxin-antitoxin system RelB family antitoxin n=1 Tax=Caballeronia sp. LjRoot34 TaxID=3342325 RepID=UPI003ECF0B38